MTAGLSWPFSEESGRLDRTTEEEVTSCRS